MANATTSRYMEWIETIPLRPIRSDAPLESAVAVMRTLLGIDRSEDEADYLDVLGDLIHA